MGLLDSSEVGLINQLLMGLGIVDAPLPLLYNTGAVLTGMIYSYLPFMVLLPSTPTWSSSTSACSRPPATSARGRSPPSVGHPAAVAQRHHRRRDDGVHPRGGRFVIPDLLGGGGVQMIGRNIWDDFGPNQDWPMAAAVAVVMVLLLIVPIVIFNRSSRREARNRHEPRAAWLGCARLARAGVRLPHIPILCLVVFPSLRARSPPSSTVSRCAGTSPWSTIARSSRRCGCRCASARWRRAPRWWWALPLPSCWRASGPISAAVFAGMTTAPMVMPEVVTGLSLVLLFTHPALSFLGGRGALAIWAAHTTLCAAYAAVLVQSRLRELDRSLEEAALDLGCPPFKVFFIITVPVIAPALVSAWLLTFTLSMDDFVLAAMLSDPGSTTCRCSSSPACITA